MSSIYVDLDDVISKTTSHYIKILDQEFGKSVFFENITSFDLKDSFSLTGDEYEYFFKLVHTPDVILSLELMEGVNEVLSNWKSQGHSISVVTGRLTSAYESSLEWLRLNNIPLDSFIMVDKYSRKGIDKNVAVSLKYFSQMKFAFAVEDSVEMANFISQEMSTKVLLFDQPWNRSFSGDNNINRCMSWYEIDRVFREINLGY